MNFYAFHLGDYVSATAHLTWDEDMAYRRLLDAYYSREAPIPVEQRQAYRLARASTQEQREAVDSVLQEFFEKTEFGWFHARCEAEIHAVAGKREKASQSAKARWRNAGAMQSQSERKANAPETPCERIENECEGNAPIPTPTPKENQKHLSPPSADDQPAKKKSAFDPLTTKPPNVSAKVWADFVAHRKGKSKLTAVACELIAAKLTGHPDPDVVLNQSIENGWTGIFPEKVHAASKQPGGQGFNSAVDQVKRAIAEREARSAQAESNNDRQALAEDDGDLRPPLDVEFRRVG